MPWYDYQCEKCGAVFEVQRAMGEDGKVKCHVCGSTRTTKIYSAAPVVFKGSGFYVTDSGGRSKQSALDPPSPGEIAETAAKAVEPASKSKSSKTTKRQTA